MKPEAIVAGARRLVGCRFRPQGRDSAFGLDCVGLVIEAYRIPEAGVRRDYRLRGDHRSELQRALAAHFTRSRKNAGPGALLLCEVARDQLHLAVDCGGSFIHADAGIGRVVETPGAPRWPVIATYRRRSSPRKG